MRTAELEDRTQESTYTPEAGSLLRSNSSSNFCNHKWIAFGLFLLVLGVYILTSPGRIDIVDGQARFDVTYNWLVNGRPEVRDSWIGPFMSISGRDGLHYSYYGAPASVFAMPLVGMGLLTSAPAIQPSQFLFSLTSSLFGAAIAPILFLFYLEFGLTTRKAMAWTLVSSFATYLWPISNSTFDNAQHAFFAITALYLGLVSARRKSAAYAIVAGSMAGVLVLYQEYFLLLAPALALPVLSWSEEDAELATSPKPTTHRLVWTAKRLWQQATNLIREAWNGPGEARSSCTRYGLFLTAVGVGLILSLAYNDLRFGSWFEDGKIRFAAQRNYPLFGNPVAGFLTLLVSPGKSIFLYSPVLLLGILGIFRLGRRAPSVVAAISLTSLILVLFISCISFAGGDWCWGPRYLTLLLPLWSLASPFAISSGWKRGTAVVLISLGFLIQGLALSVENQRFFFERSVNDFFWAEDPWFYFKHSALAARVGEAASLRDGVPASTRWFTSLPVPNYTTYTVLGPPTNVPRSLAPVWMRNYQIFFLPRPWPLWMSWLPSEERPIDPGRWLVGVLGVALLGAGLSYKGYQEGKANE